VVLDDPFTGLDGSTEDTVIDNLLGSKGWFRQLGVTAFIIGLSGTIPSTDLFARSLTLQAATLMPQTVS